MEQNSLLKKCEICDEYAKSLCYECMTYYCDACYKYVHEKQKNIKHKKEQIDPYVPIDTKCSLHPKNSISLFCLEEKGNFIYYIN